MRFYPPQRNSTTEAKKFEAYRAIDSLQEYVMVAQDRPHIERYLRQPQGKWLFSEVVGLETTLDLPSIDCELVLADVYAKVVFEGQDGTGQDAG